MLPEIAESFTRSFTGEELADHYGSQQASGGPDPTIPLPPAAHSARVLAGRFNQYCSENPLLITPRAIAFERSINGSRS
jgi:hypothetical protein